ncbi:protein adenylyltransferase SelO family protein [Comamonas fluminis]|uniref:protein adenylyltransferase SelO family protein n=1 Tax=Comamonas fluminis TaxID=2796366 RepID=UPI001C43BE7D|nr:protein adenylyltransferase SelO family protein [Comamonas fluminis]
MSDLDLEAQAPESALEEGKVFDYITGKQVKETDKERVRQRIARAIIHEYGIAAEDMEPDFKVKLHGKNRKIDIAIFKPGQPHTEDNLYRAVVVEKEPKIGTKGAYRMRDPEEARKEFELLETVMAEVDSCDYGLWTNGLEFFFFKKEVTRFDTKFKPIGDWPLGDDTFSVEGRSMGRLRRAEPEMLRIAFRRCHNYIHGNEGMPKDAAFWQFLYLIFCKMYDEQQPNEARQFWVGAFEPFDPAGREQIRKRIKPLFEAVKKKYHGLFKGNEEITLSDRALAFIVSELARYDFGRTDVDAKGTAYQEIVGTNLRGDRGQYFTPRGAIRLVVQMLAPKEHERVLDSSCGTGGFLVETLIRTGERVNREGSPPGAILVRVAASHLRVGTFEFFAAREEEVMLRRLLDYAVARHDPALAKLSDKPIPMLEAVCERQAQLIARWMGVGFIHGVMNTDNMSISGETIDYGPCAFMEGFDPATVFSSIDRQGRYAYGQQPAMAQWNLARLAEALLPVLDARDIDVVERVEQVVAGFAVRFDRHWTGQLRAKLGLAAEEPDDRALADDFLQLLQREKVDFTLAFRLLSDAITGPDAALHDLFGRERPALSDWLARWRQRMAREGRTLQDCAATAWSVNPFVIPRNHQVEAALSSAVDEADLGPFERLLAVLGRPYETVESARPFTLPASPEVAAAHRTFCGT